MKKNSIYINKKSNYYINPSILITMLLDELNLGLSYEELNEYCNNASITISEKEIINFLEEKRNLEYPNLLEDISNERKKEKSTKLITLEEILSTFVYDKYTLHYYKVTISILKTRCLKFFKLINLIINQNLDQKTELNRLLTEYDISLNEQGEILYSDILRIVIPLINNIKELKKHLDEGNTLETYLKKKMSIQRHSMLKEGFLEHEMYPRIELQIEGDNDLYIPLTQNQKDKICEEKTETLHAWIQEDKADFDACQKLGKTPKNN